MIELYKKPSDSNQGLFSDGKEDFNFSLIKVKNGKVNARGLWEFLEINRDFSNWIKDQIERLDLEENIDYNKKGETIGIKKNARFDYFLEIDIAKEVAMISQTSRGKQARKYFIECEKKLREVSKPKQLSTFEILEITQNEIKRLKKENEDLGKDLNYKNQIVIERAESVPAQTMRITINRVVRDFAKKEGLMFTNVWKKLYKEFKYLYHVDLETRAKKGKSKIQIAEDLGVLEDLYNLSLKMFEADKSLAQEIKDFAYIPKINIEND
jgi:phage anti-repressor protein